MLDFSNFEELFKQYKLLPNEIETLKVLVWSGNKSEAARAGGMSRQNLYDRLAAGDNFFQAYEALTEEVVSSQQSREPALYREAVDTLVSVMRGQHELLMNGEVETKDKVTFVKDSAYKLAQLLKDNQKKTASDELARSIQKELQKRGISK